MFLRLNGWALSVRDRSVSQARVAVSEASAESFNGRTQRHRQGLVDEYFLDFLFLQPEYADIVSALIEGQGHRFPLDGNAFSDSGIGPEVGSAIDFPQRSFGATPTGVHGTHYLRLTVGNYMAWDLGLPEDAWTVIWFRRVASAATYPFAEHVAVNSRGQKWTNGFRFDALSTTELLVGGGLVQFNYNSVDTTTNDIDEVVVLPFVAPEDLIVALYRWSTVRDFSAQLGTQLDCVDESKWRSTVIASSSFVTVDDAPTGKGVLFIPGGGYLNYGSSNGFYLFGQGLISIEFWIKPERYKSGFILSRGSSWSLTCVETEGAGGVGGAIGCSFLTALGSAYISTVSVSSNAWAHVVVSIDLTTATGAIYVNGENKTAAAIISPGDSFVDDRAGSLIVGNDSSLVSGFNGSMSALRKYRVALTEEEARDRYRAARMFGRNHPGGSSRYPPSPTVEVFGDVTCSEAVQAAGEVTAEPVLPLRAKDASSFRSNVRTVNATLRQRSIQEPIFPAAPLAQFRFGEIANIDGVYADTSRTITLTPNGAPFVYVPGPYGNGRAISMDGTGVDFFSFDGLSPLHSMLGLAKFSIAAWIRTNSLAVNQDFFYTTLTDGSTKHLMRVTTTGNFQAFIRVNIAGLQRVVSTPALSIQANTWHLVGFSCDVAAATSKAFVDASYEATANTVFTAFAMTAFGGATNRIGKGTTFQFNGDIAGIYFFDKLLTRKDFGFLWRNGPNGFLLKDRK